MYRPSRTFAHRDEMLNSAIIWQLRSIWYAISETPDGQELRHILQLYVALRFCVLRLLVPEEVAVVLQDAVCLRNRQGITIWLDLYSGPWKRFRFKTFLE